MGFVVIADLATRIISIACSNCHKQHFVLGGQDVYPYIEMESALAKAAVLKEIQQCYDKIEMFCEHVKQKDPSHMTNDEIYSEAYKINRMLYFNAFENKFLVERLHKILAIQNSR
jgi:hypothetical protein